MTRKKIKNLHFIWVRCRKKRSLKSTQTKNQQNGDPHKKKEYQIDVNIILI